MQTRARLIHLGRTEYHYLSRVRNMMTADEKLEVAMFNYFDLELTREDAESGSHPGQCDEDVAALRDLRYIRNQLDALDPEKVRRELREYGAWDDEELSDHGANLSRVLWLACGNIVEESP